MATVASKVKLDSKAECCDQLKLAHVAGNETYKKEETKTNKRHCPVSSVEVKIREDSPTNKSVLRP